MQSKDQPTSSLDRSPDRPPSRALLIGAYRHQLTQELAKEQLEELTLLAQTYGVQVIEKTALFLRRFEAATLMGKGKLEELHERARELAIDLVIMDDEISPAQQRNLEKAFQVRVMDRTELILEVFAQRARSREARLQIELARVKYQAPRLKRLWTHLERQAGTAGGAGGAYLKGVGEKQIELDRRMLKERAERLKQEIAEVRANRETQRSGRERSGIPTFALIGYTNVGKSTLLNALTDAGVFVEDKLFATLDTTTRKMTLRNGQEILLIDTVGFIRKLPHLLVTAFRSTLEEAVQADVLLHVVDASHPLALEQAKTTFEVLKELSAEEKPVVTLLNKIDLCADRKSVEKLRLQYPNTVAISALERLGWEELEEMLLAVLSKQRRQLRLRIPQSDYGRVAEIMRQGHILNRDYEENDVKLLVEVPISLAGRLTPYLETGI